MIFMNRLATSGVLAFQSGWTRFQLDFRYFGKQCCRWHFVTNKRKTNFYYVSSGHSEVLIAKTGIISVEGVRFQASDAIDCDHKEFIWESAICFISWYKRCSKCSETIIICAYFIWKVWKRKKKTARGVKLALRKLVKILLFVRYLFLQFAACFLSSEVRKVASFFARF